MKVGEYLQELISRLESRVDKDREELKAEIEKLREEIKEFRKGNFPTTIILGIVILIAGIADKLPWDQILGAVIK